MTSATSSMEADMVTVYDFMVWDTAKGRYSHPEAKATLDHIVAAGGLIIPMTEEDVTESELSSDGRYCAPPRSAIRRQFRK
jgi:hypothetical protein